jgi:hypothetical protein
MNGGNAACVGRDARLRFSQDYATYTMAYHLSKYLSP